MTVINNAPSLCPTESTDIDINSVTANAVIELINITISPNPAGVSGNTTVGAKWGFGETPLPATIADDLSNSTNDIQTITYEFEVSASGFTGTSTQSAVVTVNPDPAQTITNTNTTINNGQKTDILINTPTENGQVTLISVNTTDPGLTGNTAVGASFPDGTTLEDILLNPQAHKRLLTNSK